MLAKDRSLEKKALCIQILEEYFPSSCPASWQVGNEKVFLKDDIFMAIERKVTTRQGMIVLKCIYISFLSLVSYLCLNIKFFPSSSAMFLLSSEIFETEKGLPNYSKR